MGFFISFLAFSFQNELLKSQKLEQWIFIQCLLIVFLVLYLLEIYLMNSVIPSATKLNTNIDLAQNGMIEIKKERIRTLKQALDDNEQNNNKYNNRVINATLFFIFSLIFNTIFQNIFKNITSMLMSEWFIKKSHFCTENILENIILCYASHPVDEFFSPINTAHLLFCLILSFTLIRFIRKRS